MLTLSARQQVIIGSILALFITATRSHHIVTLSHLPDASWAVFFLTGVYLRSIKILPVMLVWAGILDFVSYALAGGSGFCLTPAYGFLVPAYTILWLTGRWYAHSYSFAWQSLLTLFLMVFTVATTCELLTSGGFYFFSGRFMDTTMMEFGSRFLKYYPGNLQSVTFYVDIAAIVHVMVSFARLKSGNEKTASNTQN